jgi:hypothetical protein
MSRAFPARICARISNVGIVILVLYGCATPMLAPGAEKVHLTHKAADVINCKAVGNINPAQDAKGKTFSTPTEFRNQAVGLGGNTVFVASQYMGAPVEGVAYFCAREEVRAFSKAATKEWPQRVDTSQ